MLKRPKVEPNPVLWKIACQLLVNTLTEGIPGAQFYMTENSWDEKIQIVYRRLIRVLKREFEKKGIPFDLGNFKEKNTPRIPGGILIHFSG